MTRTAGIRRTRAAGAGRTLLAASAGFALAAGAWFGLFGLSTSVFSMTLERRQVVPLLLVALAVYAAAGVVALAMRKLRSERSRPGHPLQGLFQAMFTVTVWAGLTVTFLPLKGSEAFVEAGRLTTVQLNLLALAAVAAVGLVAGYVLARVTARVVAALERSFGRPAARAVGLVAALAAVLVALLGASGDAVPAELPQPVRGSVPRVMLVGVDGCDWERLEPLVRDGRLPEFERLMSEGSYGPLMSLEKLVSPRIWTTIATGRLPDGHGILDFVNAQGVPVNATMVTAPTVWDIASAHGLPVGVTGWYVTWPVTPLRGFVVSDRTHSLLRGPVQVAQSLTGDSTNERLERFGAFEFDPDYKSYPVTEKRYQQNRIVDEPLRWGYLRDHIYSQIAFRLYPLYRPTLGAVYFRGVDFVEHFFWKYSDPEPFGDVTQEEERAYGEVISNYYVYQDRLLGRLLDSLGDDVNVIIVSDHGFQARTDPPASRPQLTGMHERKAVLIAAGPAFRTGVRVDSARVEDVAPTVLAVMGLPVPEDMDGRVLDEIIVDAHLAAHPVRTVPSYEPLLGSTAPEGVETGEAMDESIREQLRSLGYIE